jgi:acetylglutamate kinase
MTVRVVKIGGAALSDAGWLTDFAAQVAASASPVVVIHGGGPDINEVAAALGLLFTWVEGRRVTSPELLDAVSMVLNGRVNKRIVRSLTAAGVDAIGLSGEDGALIRAEFAAGGALGRVGVVSRVRGELIRWLLDRGAVPVIAPVSAGPDGGPLNVNADEAAAAVAVALDAEELLFITDVEGVLEDGVVRASLSAADAESLVATGVATGGMALKLRAAVQALEMGVPCVRIGRSQVLVRDTAGTRIRTAGEVVTCP